ncbi:hypothetical protein SH449x_004629 [Pirellulaceae bacterium SH449]
MQDYAIQKSSRRCFDSDRTLAPGERYYSAIIQKGSDLIRRDYSAEKWTGPNDGVVGWWVCKVPQKQTNKKRLAPNHVLLDTLQSFLETPGKESLAYLLALLLLRKKVLGSDSGFHEADAPADDVLDLCSSNGERSFMVPVVELTTQDTTTLQAELLDLLYSEE